MKEDNPGIPGAGPVPFPQARPSRTLREEDAFMEAFAEPEYRIGFHLAAVLRSGWQDIRGLLRGPERHRRQQPGGAGQRGAETHPDARGAKRCRAGEEHAPTNPTSQ